MATISTLYKTGTHNISTLGATRPIVRVQNYIDMVDVIASKGGAIAVGDVIEAIRVPAGFQVLFAGIQKITAMTGSSTDTTFDLGITGGDVDAFVDGWDYDAAAVNAYATPASASITPATFLTTGDTIDILIATQTGTITGGIVRVFAHLLDCNDELKGNAGLVQIGT